VILPFIISNNLFVIDNPKPVPPNLRVSCPTCCLKDSNIVFCSCSGREFLGRIKKDIRYKSIPVIMLTTISQKDKVIDAIRAGAKQYLTKPFSGEDLLTKIVQALGINRL